MKLYRVCGWLAVIKTRHTRGSAEQDRENNVGYSRVNELSQPDNLQWCRVVCVCVWMNEVFSLMWAIIWPSWEEQEEWCGKYSAQIQTGGPFLSLLHAGEKRNPVDPECRKRVKKNICCNVGIKRTEKESTRQNKLEPCVNRVYRNQIWPILKVIYRENAFSRVH